MNTNKQKLTTKKKLNTNNLKKLVGGMQVQHGNPFGADGPAAVKSDTVLVKSDTVLRK